MGTPQETNFVSSLDLLLLPQAVLGPRLVNVEDISTPQVLVQLDGNLKKILHGKTYETLSKTFLSSH